LPWVAPLAFYTQAAAQMSVLAVRTGLAGGPKRTCTEPESQEIGEFLAQLRFSERRNWQNYPWILWKVVRYEQSI
jgi:hypothetical protein